MTTSSLPRPLPASSRLPLDCALALVHLYGRKKHRRYEPAALRYLERYLTEAQPSLADVAQVAGLLAERALLMRGLQQ